MLLNQLLVSNTKNHCYNQHAIQVDENTGLSTRILQNFANPLHSIWSVISNTFGGADGALFDNNSEEGYEWLSYSLFTLFLIAMPVLFNNFLVYIAN